MNYLFIFRTLGRKFMMKEIVFLYFLLVQFSVPIFAQDDLNTYSKDTLLMGSAFTFTAVHTDSIQANQIISAGIKEVIRIEKTISSWNVDSETAHINANAGKHPVGVSKELFDLINRCIKISRLTDGYFDITFASMDKVWNFNKTAIKPPDSAIIKASIQRIGYEKIETDRTNYTVFLKEEEMKIGFGATGKGYAANKAKKVMVALGAESGVVNAGGDLLAWGDQPDGKPWSVGIADPEDKSKMVAWLNASNTAVVTSGNYEKYVMIDDKRYGHIINPKTGWPVTGLTSVTIICPDAELADGLATAVFVMGEEAGMQLINQLNGIECIIVNDEHKMSFSENIQEKYFLE